MVRAVKAAPIPDLDTCYALADEGAEALGAWIPEELSGDVLDCLCEKAFEPEELPAPAWHYWEPAGVPTYYAVSTVLLPGQPLEIYYGTTTLNERWWWDGAWHEQPLGDSLRSAPAAVGVPGHRWVFFRTMSNDVAVREWDGATWLPARNLGMRGDGAPAAAIKDGEVYVFARDFADHLYMKKTTGGVWNGWATWINSGVTSAVAALPHPSDPGFDLLYRGPGGELRVQSPTTTNEWGWYATPSTSLGGTIVGAPAAVRLANGLIDVYVRFPDNTIRQQWTTGTGWSGFYQMPDALIIDAPAVNSVHPGHRVVLARGTDGALYYRHYY